MTRALKGGLRSSAVIRNGNSLLLLLSVSYNYGSTISNFARLYMLNRVEGKGKKTEKESIENVGKFKIIVWNN